MNVSGWIRGLMSKNMDGEKFFITVAKTIEQELQQWDPEYEVFLLKLKDYHLVVKKGALSYEITISEQELAELQDRSPFSLDRKIWLFLQAQGLQIIKGYGNYIEYCLM